MDRHYQSRARAVLLACVLLALIAQLALLPVRAMAAAPSDDLALNKTAVADSQEADSVRASNATDGDETSRTSRWGSDRDSGGGAHWIYVDLGAEKNVASVKVFWENRKATAYRIQYATGETAPGVIRLTVSFHNGKLRSISPFTLNCPIAFPASPTSPMAW